MLPNDKYIQKDYLIQLQLPQKYTDSIIIRLNNPR